MANKDKKDRMAWFKMDAGSFLAETTGLSNNHVGIYMKLIALYWTGGNSLPDNDTVLNRRLGVTDAKDVEALTEILTEFFPKDGAGKYCHVQLDSQLQDIKEFSQQQSLRASNPRPSSSKPLSNNTYDAEF